MKNLKLFLLGIIAITLTACSSDDENPEQQIDVTSLGGAYRLDSIETFYSLTETAPDGSEIIIEREICEGIDVFADFIFHSDGTLTTDGTYKNVCDKTSNGMTTTSSEIIELNDSLFYTANNSNRTITIDFDVFDVTSFTGRVLEISLNETAVFDGFENSQTERYEIKMRLVMLTL